MTRPTCDAVKQAINDLASQREEATFKPSEVRKYLEASCRYTATSSALSAQIQPHLNELRRTGYIELDPNFNLQRNRPHRMVRAVYGETAPQRPRSDGHNSPAVSEIKLLKAKVENLESKIDALSQFITSRMANDLRLLNETPATFQPPEGLPYHILDAEPVDKLLESLSRDNRDLFDQLTSWASETAHREDCEPIVIRGYTNQPSGFNGKPQIIFVKTDANGRTISGSRIYGIAL